MRFLVDAQLPPSLASLLAAHGHDAIHAADLPEGVLTLDAAISTVADQQDRVVVTKDADFRHSHVTRGTPRRLLVVATGNIANRDLHALFSLRLGEIVRAFTGGDFVELRRDLLIVHGARG